MRTRRPPLYSVLALWLSCTLSATAQEFYIELRGPETAAAQDRPAPAPETPPAPARASRYGPITPTDTLWSIAARHTRAPATVQQTMVALYYLNLGAFVRGNINYLQRGAVLRLPTLSQAQQRSPREAENEFRRLSRQGNRRVTQAPATPAPARAVARVETPRPAETAAPAVATPPVVEAAPRQTQSTAPAASPQPAPATGLSEPRAAAPAAVTPPAPAEPRAAPVAPTTPEQAEQAALERLQARLLDELREQVAMSNEQLAQLADNNQALRHRLSQLTAEVNELKMVRAQQATPEANAAVEQGGWFSELLRQPLNLALLLTLPALLLLALFTLWWRKRVREDMAEQEADSSQLMMEDEDNEFDDLFATELSAVEEEPPATGTGEQVEIDEDAFARFLEEQERQEQEEAETRGRENPDEALLDDDAARPGTSEDMLFEDDMADPASDAERAVDPDDILFEDEMAGPALKAGPDVDPDDILFEDEMAEDKRREGSAEDSRLDRAADHSGPDAMVEDAREPSLFGNNADDEGAFDEHLFDLDEPEQKTVAQQASAGGPESRPGSLAEQGAFEEEAGSRFDDLLAESMANQAGGAADDGKPAGPDQVASPFEDREPLLRHELDDYAGLLGNGQDVDIDLDEGGMGAKLDLARAYIEIDDLDSARELLNEAMEKGNEQQRNDARKLLQRLDRR
ncbi:hypothetical protein PU634_09020 [Oceanimonas pelagia]|uniref:Pilus assembly protein FimV n=1 Tax=Oceanimonas pelagia TaxID=3028314 RepID=A0AA50KJE3_9GAMM|nr:FimV/HubP family polar landmark protein [Oceanimonas pelagia]WMC09271.1 hypothetical protein PU634_09020 [Oceanimonas pelagia]